jgi:hypothetical protein
MPLLLSIADIPSQTASPIITKCTVLYSASTSASSKMTKFEIRTK